MQQANASFHLTHAPAPYGRLNATAVDRSMTTTHAHGGDSRAPVCLPADHPPPKPRGAGNESIVYDRRNIDRRLRGRRPPAPSQRTRVRARASAEARGGRKIKINQRHCTCCPFIRRANQSPLTTLWTPRIKRIDQNRCLADSREAACPYVIVEGIIYS